MESSQVEQPIPCEICSSMIMFNDYVSHLEECYVRSRSATRERARINQLHNTLFQALVSSQGQSLDSLPLFFRNSNINIQLQSIQNIEQSIDEVPEPVVDNSHAFTTIEDDQLDETIMCNICYEVSERTFVRTPCAHVYCKVCLETWLRKKRSCPMCNTTL